jgi:hypothetical protein
MPDFVIIKDGYVEFLEVKFRSGRPDPESHDCKALAETWPESNILFVCKTEPYFRVARICQFVEKNHLFPLETDKYMNVSEEIVKKYAKQVIASYGV